MENEGEGHGKESKDRPEEDGPVPLKVRKKNVVDGKVYRSDSYGICGRVRKRKVRTFRQNDEIDVESGVDPSESDWSHEEESGVGSESDESASRLMVEVETGLILKKWKSEIRGNVYTVESETVEAARRAVALRVLKDDYGIEPITHRYLRHSKKKCRRTTPVHVLRELHGSDIHFRFVQHWSLGDTHLREEILTYETRLDNKVVSAKGGTTSSAKNFVAMEALMRIYPQDLLHRVHGSTVRFQKLNLIDEHVTFSAEVNGKTFLGRGVSQKEAMDNAAVRALHSEYKAYLDAICKSLAINPKPLSPMEPDTNS